MTDRLPHTLQQIAEAAGVDAALTLALAMRGRRMRIPKKAEASQLADIVGIDAARKIVKDLANVRIEVPPVSRILARWLAGQGWSQEDIAHRLGKSRRTIQYWLTNTTPTRQFDLFDQAS